MYLVQRLCPGRELAFPKPNLLIYTSLLRSQPFRGFSQHERSTRLLLLSTGYLQRLKGGLLVLSHFDPKPHVCRYHWKYLGPIL